MHVLESSKKWRAEFPKTKLLKDLAVSCAGCLDDMTAGQVFAMEAIHFLETNTSKALAIVEKNEQALKDAAKEMDKLRKQVKELQTAQEKTTKTVEEASQKQKTNLTKVQRTAHSIRKHDYLQEYKANNKKQDGVLRRAGSSIQQGSEGDTLARRKSSTRQETTEGER